MIEKQPNNSVQTSVQEVDLDIDSWLGAPGADSIVTPASSKEDEKPSIFAPRKTDLSFLDEEPASEEEKEVSRETNEILQDIDKELNIEKLTSDDDTPSRGRPRTEKAGLVEFLKKRIESGEMFAFDDYDEKKESL